MEFTSRVPVGAAARHFARQAVVEHARHRAPDDRHAAQAAVDLHADAEFAPLRPVVVSMVRRHERARATKRDRHDAQHGSVHPAFPVHEA
jgi:hypothetical protein